MIIIILNLKNIKKINWLNITSGLQNESFISSRPLGCYKNDLDLMIVLKHKKVNMELYKK